MSQIASDSEPAEALTPTQLTALEALNAGATVTAAAAGAGVNRVTLHRWLRDDFAFQAAFNQARRDLREAAATRLLTVAGMAADTVQDAVEAGDVRTSVAVLQGLGLLSGVGTSVGSGEAKSWSWLPRVRHKSTVSRPGSLVSRSENGR